MSFLIPIPVLPLELWVQILSHFTDPDMINMWLHDKMFGAATRMATRRLMNPLCVWQPSFSQLNRLEEINIQVNTLEGLLEIAALPRLTRGSLRLMTRNSRVYLDWIIAFQTTFGHRRSFDGTWFQLLESLDIQQRPLDLVYTIDHGVPLLQSLVHGDSLHQCLCYDLADILRILTSFRQVAPLWCYDNRWHLVIRPDPGDIMVAIELSRFLQSCPELTEIRTTTDCVNYVIITQLLPRVEVFRLDGPGWIWDLPAAPKIRILDARIDLTYDDMAKFTLKYPQLEELSVRAPWALKDGLSRVMYRDFWNHFHNQLVNLPGNIKRIGVADLGSQWSLPSDPRIYRLN